MTLLDVQAPFLLHRVRVLRKRRLSPGFARITFGGATLDTFADPGLDQRIKLILPAADGALDALPLTGDWYEAWRALPEARRPVIRTYTTRAVRPGEVDLDVVLHEPCGPAGAFAAACVPGDELVLLGPNTAAPHGGGIDFRLPASARRVLVAGDETALPAIARILEALPDDLDGTVVIEVPHAADAVQLPAHPRIRTVVVPRGDAAHGQRLEAAVRRLVGSHGAPGEVPEDVDGLLWEVPGDGPIPAADGAEYAWLAGEAGVITRLRRLLVRDRGWDRRTVAFMGYWRAGRAEGG